MNPKEWERVKKLAVVPTFVKDLSGLHQFSVKTKKVLGRRPPKKMVSWNSMPWSVKKESKLAGMTNHERVVTLRAKRQGLSVAEYRAKYGA